MDSSFHTTDRLEEDDLDRVLRKCGEDCAACGDELLYMDEVFLLVIVYPAVTPDGSFVLEPAVADDGDFLYAPRFLSLECWEELYEDLCGRFEDTPPLLDNRAVLDCSSCGSGIRLGELLCLATFGEIHCSQRSPDGVAASSFEELDTEPCVICISCLRLINDDINGMWEGDVQQDNECPDGTAMRCWRYGCPGGPHCINGVKNGG